MHLFFCKDTLSLVNNSPERFLTVAKKKNISKLLIIFVVLNFYFLLDSISAEAAKRKRWFNSVNVTGGITAALQGTSGNNDSTAETQNSTDFSYSLDLNLNYEIASRHKFFAHIETGEGKGVNDNFATFINPNYDPFNTLIPDTKDIAISQAFYEGVFLEEMLTIDIGKMDVHSFSDGNNFAGDEKSQFMAGIFVRLPGTLFTVLDDYYSPGIRFFLTPNEWFEATYIAASALNDSVGKDVYHVGQVNIKPNVFDLEGNYRFYFISDGRNYTKIDDIDKTATSNSGWGVSFDQLITQNLGMFFRYGTQKDDLTANTVKSATSVGVSINGDYWRRSDDFVGIGYGIVKKNDKITTAYSGDQKVTEIFYHFQLWDNVSITPDIQFHKNLPRTDTRDISVYGIRVQIDFF